MKRILLIVLTVVIAVSMSGCMRAGGSTLEGINIEDAADASKIKDSDYKDNLEGLEKYLKALGYIPENSEPTEMMYAVIGAKDGDRYNFTLSGTTIFVELYQYDPENLNKEAKRVIGEVKEKGKFRVFSGDKEEDAFDATLSYSGKYLVMYTGDNNEEQTNRKKDFIKAVKEFHKG